MFKDAQGNAVQWVIRLLFTHKPDFILLFEELHLSLPDEVSEGWLVFNVNP